MKGRPTRVCGCLLMSAGLQLAFSQSLFEGHGDIGNVLYPGSVEYDDARKSYTVTGSGANIWAAHDDFQFVWKKVSAEDIGIAADIAMLGAEGDPHRKAVLMVRQSLDADAAYADAALHGSGLTSLQFRESKGAATHEIESNVSGPRRLRLEKRGDRFYLWIGGDEHDLRFAGGSARVLMKTPFYIGIGVCAHNKDAIQKAAFTNVEVAEASGYSTIETISVQSTDALVSYVTRDHIEAPEFSADGMSLLFHTGTSTMRVPAAGGIAEAVPPKSEKQASERLSPDGKWMAVAVEEDDEMTLAVISVADGTMKTLAKFAGGPGSLSAHPWSPDGKRLVFVSYQTIGSADKPGYPSSPRR